jgi:hypothetical protein
MVGTRCTTWAYGRLGKVPLVWIDIVDGFGKVPIIRFVLWSVPGVWNGIVDGLERYLIYRLGLWMVWKGAQSMVWLMIVSIMEARV